VIIIIQKNEIIVRHKNGQSKSFIAKEMGIARNTVKAYIKEYELLTKNLSTEKDKTKIVVMQELICCKPTRKQYVKPCSVFTEALKQRFNELIKIDEERNMVLGKNKQQLTAALLYRSLVQEGFKVGETTIRRYFGDYKQKHKECFIKQFYEYGDVAQYDFHQIKVMIDGTIMVFHQATISIPKCNIIFGLLYKNERMESFIDSLVQFFHFCKGVFKTLVFDNMSNVIKRFVYKKDKEYTDELVKLSNYYGFQIQTCNPYSGNEKGHVENSGKVIRRDFFSLNYKFDRVEDLYLYYERELEKRNAPFMDEFVKEQKYLLPLPTHPFELGRLQYAKANSFSLISIDGSFYSVPDKYVEKRVTCNIYRDFIMVYDDKMNLIAEHNIKDGKGEYSINIKHYIDTLLKKPKALKNSYALKQAPEILQTIYTKYFSTKPREFLHFLMDTDAFNDDLYELGIEMGVIKKSKYRRTIEYLNRKDYSDIDKTSIKQLAYTSNVFGQEGVSDEKY